MDEVSNNALEHVALVLTGKPSSLSQQDGVELGKSLADLADRIEAAVGVLRELVELVNPRGLPEDLHLTTRELEIFGVLGEGHSNVEIAKHCWISENTVKFHLKNLFRKLGVRDRGQAMMMSRAFGRRLNSEAQPAPRASTR